ncbi:hypothetical protein, conserved [Entamoeba dispar SAW760]|uniref:AIG1-type G domain-containing protein n=1 Tax=Entamoeba dispar (strain ATCC PRA-260 / SAW760) TaxID=370354 RepID=B0EC78_ENTDS|nr:uncharacterized protein EDI_251000 [Entamoeba dispar SAW760]EDR27868.1 hypothetical protein, conserved [Entamoeba dispar SAW760]|eukprot:EDR27868.1 hypothetical protein, conserved [Entamoeba dispar SAW760]
MSKVTVRFFLNGKSISTKPLNSQDNLKTAREKLSEKISGSHQFLTKEGDLIDINDEDSFTIEDVIGSSRIINIKEKEDKKEVKIKLNDKLFKTIELDKKTKLSDVRKSIQNIPESAHFYTLDNNIIEKDEEDIFLVEDILNNDEIIIKKEKENTPAMDIVDIGIDLNGNPKTKRKLNKNSYLSDIRKEIENIKNIPKDFMFKDKEGYEIQKDEEQSLKLSDILYDNKINITIEVSNTSSNDLTDLSEPNAPIEGSIRLKNHEEGKLKIYLYPNEPFNSKDESDAIAILVIGQTGSGKTTLLNSFVNALYGIKITDDFRYIIINEDNLKQSGDQSKSQTSEVTIYNIKRTKKAPPIKIIDTPGFGDTRGMEYDKVITNQIKKAFETKVLDLNAICFVAQSSNPRLTASQKYILDNIINLFGKDVKKNFIAMLTFSDGETPKILCSLQSKDCVFSTIIPEIDKPWYLKFNCLYIYKDNTENPLTQNFWELSMKNFDEFIKKVKKLPRTSLEKSRDVLKSREQIKTEIEGLRISLNNGLSKMNNIKNVEEQIDLNREKINKNKDYKILTPVRIPILVDLKPGEYVTNCLYCHKTCHYPCYIKGDIKKGCSCIGANGYCNVCGCHYIQHTNSPYRHDEKTEIEEQTLEKVLERYNEGKEGMASAEATLAILKKEYDKIKIECHGKLIKMVECINVLSSNALNGKITSSNDYLDQLIESENEEQKSGYKERVKGYKELKETNEIIEYIMKKPDSKSTEGDIIKELDKIKKKINTR